MTTTNKVPWTAGPWRVQPDPEWAGKHPYHDHRFITCGKSDMTSDEWVNDTGSYVIASLRDCQNQEANARLIAAAPEMAEALREIANRGPVDGYSSASALRLRLVATQSIARALLFRIESE